MGGFGNQGKSDGSFSPLPVIALGSSWVILPPDEGLPEVRVQGSHQALFFSEGLLGVAAYDPQPPALLLSLLHSAAKAIRLLIHLKWGCVTGLPSKPCLAPSMDWRPPDGFLLGRH